MTNHFEDIREIYSSGERFDEMQTYTNRRLKKWEEEVFLLFPKAAKILDIGCGKGREAFCLHDKGFCVTGVDISETAVAAAKRISEQRQLGIPFHISDGMNLAFSDSSFDVVIIWAQTFGLFDTQERKKHILAECSRVLGPGGMLSLSTHDRRFLEKHYPLFMNQGLFHPFGEKGPAYQTYTLEALQNCVEESGFVTIECKAGWVYG